MMHLRGQAMQLSIDDEAELLFDEPTPLKASMNSARQTGLCRHEGTLADNMPRQFSRSLHRAECSKAYLCTG